MMENKEPTSAKAEANRILWIALATVLCISVLIAGIAASVSRKKSAATLPSDTAPPVTSTPPSADADTEPGEVILTAPVSGSVAKGHDLSLPVFSATLGEYRVHSGIDIHTSLGAEVTAAADGRVVAIGEHPLLGVSVTLDHGNGVTTVYRNLAPTLPEGLTVGSTVVRGEVLGYVGETALSECADEPHLHFEVLADDVACDPLDYISEESIGASLGGDTFYE